MDKNVIKYRNTMKELFKKYSIHRALRLNTLNDLIDEINTYYVGKQGDTITVEFHEQHLKDQLNGWIKYLESEKQKLPKDDSDYHKGIKNGFAKVIDKLKDVVKG